MTIGFYVGSFDPFTNGHLHVIEKAATIFDKVIVGIGTNADKPNRRFDKFIMKNAIEKVLIRKNLNNVEVITFENLTVDVAKEYNVTALIRGIRNGMDYVKEEIQASNNEKYSGIDTIYFRAGDLGNLSSSMVMELIRYNKDVSEYLQDEILEIVKKYSK